MSVLPLRPDNNDESQVAASALSLAVRDLSLQLSGKPILQGVSLSLPTTGVTTLIGPSGAGKSSLLRCLTRLYDHWQGRITIRDHDIRQWPGGADAWRRQVGLIAQKPAVFPQSIANNVTFGLSGGLRRGGDAELVQTCLRQAALWDEVKDRLSMPAGILSIGQQQRLCLARALALAPAILLLDEPTASLDPRSKHLLETSLLGLSQNMSVLCVTHDLEQAQRLGGQTVFMCEGRVIETGGASDVLQRPGCLETREFLQWSVCDCERE